MCVSLLALYIRQTCFAAMLALYIGLTCLLLVLTHIYEHRLVLAGEIDVSN